MATRHLRLILPALLVATAMFGGLFACSAATKYRVLSFFFDGVPPPGTGKHSPASDAIPATDSAESATRAIALASRQKTYSHPPYAQNRCGGCHNPDTGQLLKTPSEGLCRICHTKIPGRASFVHGPVAVNACTFCHHHHVSPYPKVLRHEPAGICFHCHNQDDLTEGEHHSELPDRLCFDCHDPHSGSNRFFLKRDEP